MMSDSPQVVIREFAASRISVFDAATLDKEISGFLKKQIQEITGDLPFNGIEKIQPEIDAILKIVLWFFSVERNRATFGQQLLCLKYQKDIPSNTLRLLGALTIGFSYLKNRSEQLKVLEAKFPAWVVFVAKHFEFALHSLNIVTFLIFLRRGGTPSFIETLLGIKPVSIVKPSERSIGYSYMTRELLWHGAIELFCLVLPHINVAKLGRIAKTTIFGQPKVSPSIRPPSFTTKTLCSICHATPILPHTIGCDHFFCYYCISSSQLADDKFGCPDCGYTNPEGTATSLAAT